MEAPPSWTGAGTLLGQKALLESELQREPESRRASQGAGERASGWDSEPESRAGEQAGEPEREPDNRRVRQPPAGWRVPRGWEEKGGRVPSGRPKHPP